MVNHGLEDGLVANAPARQAQVFGGSPADAQNVARPKVHRGEEIDEIAASPSSLQILDDPGLVSGVNYGLQGVSRGSAGWIVVDRDLRRRSRFIVCFQSNVLPVLYQRQAAGPGRRPGLVVF